MISEFGKAVILSKITFKIQEHIFSMSATMVQSLRLTALTLWEELIKQTWYLFLGHNPKISKFEKAIIMSKNIFPHQNSRCTSSICLQQLCEVSD